MTSHDVSQENSRPGHLTDTQRFLGKLAGLTGPEAQVQMRGFSLRLGDGSRWWITGSRHASFIAEKMGAIMHLQEGDVENDHLLFFYEKLADEQLLDFPSLHAQGWINLYQIHFQLLFHPTLHHALCEYDAVVDSSPYPLMSTAVHAVHWESICRGGIPIHAALLEHHGQGVLLAAPGGTGKSTCSRRVPPPWQARCDDEVLAVLSPEGRYLVHPFPTWTDYLWNRGEPTWKVEEALPLAGIFFIEQAHEDDCVPLEGAQAAVAATRSADEIMIFHFLGKSDNWEVRELRRNIFINACELVKQVPAFRLRVSLTGSFWEKIEAALGWR